MTRFALNWQTLKTNAIFQTYDYNTPAGKLVLLTQGKVLCKLEWLISPSSWLALQPLSETLEKQLNHAWLNSSAGIALPLLQQGTVFQRSVWSTLCQIPLGQTKTYGELAKDLNTSPRALANACRTNPFPLIIPCHRVIAKTGIGGYAGTTSGQLIDIKTTLLQHERMLTNEV